jgi:hypothetical protein
MKQIAAVFGRHTLSAGGVISGVNWTRELGSLRTTLPNRRVWRPAGG